MKALTRIVLAVAAFTGILPAALSAQQMPQLPADPDVRIGRLSNGLTYYIRHNDYPKGQADFYIAQKVGSMQEEESQRGLAHFLEHMCFNGTTNFPGKNLINYLESIGVKFGVNLNAYTAFDRTVYNINNVPVAREGVQDSCLLILHDWANDLLLLPEEIDAERAVIHEEWRRSNVGQMRILEKLLPVMFGDDKYGQRLPIGLMSVVDSFPHQELRDYYETWYRPDLQGIIVVGNIDPARIEAKVKEMFADIEMPANPRERVYFPVSDNKGTIYAIGHDTEQTNAIVELMFKTEAFPDSLRNTPLFYINSYMERMITDMLNTRLADIAAKPDAPFALAQAEIGNFFVAKTKDALTLIALEKDGKLPSALAATYRELLRAVRGGFTFSEYDRARKEYLSQAEAAYNNRKNRENSTFVNAYVENFLEGDPIPSIDIRYQLQQQVAQMVTLEMLNQTVKQFDTQDNRVLLAMLPEKDGATYPTDNDFAQALAAVDAETIEPYVDEVKSEPLIPSMPKPGSIVKSEQSKQWDATVWTLSNGATVIVKPTEFKDNEILFGAIALGGTSGLDATYDNTLMFIGDALSQSGLGTYTYTDVQKYLSGKQAGVRLALDDATREMSGTTTPKDLPTLMELIYMNFTGVNFTQDEFDALKKQTISMIHNQEANPQYVFVKTLLGSLYASPRKQQPTVEQVEKADRQQTIDIAARMTANAADWTFMFVGNVNVDSLKPLVEQYIASLPGDAATAVRTLPELPAGMKFVKGSRTDESTAAMETPQTWAAIISWADMPYTMDNYLLASIAGQILSRRLIDIVREKEGAVYSISAQGSLSRMPDNNMLIQTAFPMKPEMKQKVLDIIRGQFDDLASNISDEELNMVKEYMVKNFGEQKERNGAWLNAIEGWKLNGIDNFNGNIEAVQAVTPDAVKAFMKQALGQGNYRVVILDPAEK